MEPTRRYAGKPLTRLLELYVLWSIGHLSQPDEASLERIAPKLRSLFGGSTWQEAVAASMAMPVNAASDLRALWEEHQATALAAGAAPDPQTFAEVVVDRTYTE